MKATITTPILAPDAVTLEQLDRDARPVESVSNGYLQLIDASALMALAVEEDIVVQLLCRPGDYVVAGSPLAKISPGDKLDEGITTRINAVFALCE